MPDTSRDVTLDTATLVDEGLLHIWNRQVFWPYGLTLAVERWDDPSGEHWRSAWSFARARVMEFVAPDATPAEVIGLMEAEVSQRIRKDPYLPGLAIRMAVPPEPLHTLLPPAEAEAKRKRAMAWLRARKVAVRKQVMGA